ncbi:MAG: ABC transporter ATP-binding protein [Candidatus Methanomethylophilaceae archaeon]|nr:ABC transporter ATP-binding protein [Candidatus Methanomethylophilaceae archaeon]
MSPPVRMEKVQKAKRFWPTFFRLCGYIGKYKWRIALGVIASVISSVLVLLAPQYIKEATDLISDGIGGRMDMGAITGLMLTTVAVYAASAVFRAITQYYIPTSSELNANLVRVDLIWKIQRIPQRILDRMSVGDIMSRFSNDSDQIRRLSAESINGIVTSTVMVAGAFGMMLAIDWKLAVVAAAPVLLGMGMSALVIRASQRYFKDQAREMGALNGVVEESFYGLEVMDAYNALPGYGRKFRATTDRLYVSAFRSRFFSEVVPRMMGFVGNLSYGLVCIVGSMLILGGEVRYGAVVAVLIYVREFSQPLERLSNTISGMQSMVASAERLFEFFDLEELPDESSKRLAPLEVRGEVEFRDVHFSYVPGTECIHGMSLRIDPGQTVAIVGPTGAGKTTLANLLMRFYEVDSGSILVDGIDLRDIRTDQVREMFSVVLQDTWVFKGTIRENIAFNRTDISDGEVREACAAVGLDPFIEALPDGYDTVIGEGLSLSVGQKQQVSIARALVRRSPLIILDEATSSVDILTETLIQDSMDRLVEGRTSFVIAHRLSTIRGADLILVVDSGEVVEAGTHQELMRLGGRYRSLYDNQFETE